MGQGLVTRLKRLRALVEGFFGRVKCRLGYGRLTWQGLENVGIHVSLVLMVVYAVAIAAIRLGRRAPAERGFLLLRMGLGVDGWGQRMLFIREALGVSSVVDWLHSLLFMGGSGLWFSCYYVE